MSARYLLDDRDARIAAARAARAHFVPLGEPEWITLAELRSDDFLVLVPSQQGVVGCRFDCTVGVVETTMTEWGIRSTRRGPLSPVPAVQIVPANKRLATTCYPASFRASVRRPER